MDPELLKIESYAKAFTEKVCNGFFSQFEFIKGQEILSVTPIEQVNLFIIKNLFLRWQDENQKLKSPYFNYESEEVKEGMIVFMNTLSKHILIKKEFFKPLMEKSVLETLLLMVKTETFIQNEVGAHGKLITKDFKSQIKYFKIHKNVWNQIVSGSKNEWTVNELLEEFKKSIKSAPEEIQEYLNRFSGILPLETIKSNEEKSLIDNSEKKSTVISPLVSEKQMEEKTATSEKVIINEVFTASQQTLNDKLKQNQPKTVAENISKRQLENIRSGISLNQKFQFINFLFQGQSVEFDNALNDIERCTTYEQALTMLNSNYAARYHWDYNNPEVADFVELVERKFA